MGQHRTAGRVLQTLHGVIDFISAPQNNCFLMLTLLTEAEFSLSFARTVVLEGMQMCQEKTIQVEK